MNITTKFLKTCLALMALVALNIACNGGNVSSRNDIETSDFQNIDKSSAVIYQTKSNSLFENESPIPFNQTGGSFDGSVTAIDIDKDGNIYVGNNLCEIYKHTSNFGKWIKLTTNKPTKGSSCSISAIKVTIDNNETFIYVGDTEGNVYKCNYSKCYHQYSSSLGIKGITLSSNNTLNILREDGEIIILSNDSTHITIPGDINMSMTTDNSNNFYYGTTNGKVYKYSNESFKSLVKSTLDGSGVISLNFDNKNKILYAGTKNGNVLRFMPNSGWHKFAGPEMLGLSPLMPNSPELLDGSAVMTISINKNGSTIYFTTSKGNIFEYKDEKWNKLPEIYSNVLLNLLTNSINTIDDSLIVGTYNMGTVYQYSNNKKMWTAIPGMIITGTGDSYTSFAVDSLKNIYMGSNYGNVYKYNLSNGIVSQFSYNDIYYQSGTIYQMDFDKKNNLYIYNAPLTVYIKSSNSWISTLGFGSYNTSSNIPFQPSIILNKSCAIAQNGVYISCLGNSYSLYSYIYQTNSWTRISAQSLYNQMNFLPGIPLSSISAVGVDEYGTSYVAINSYNDGSGILTCPLNNNQVCSPYYASDVYPITALVVAQKVIDSTIFNDIHVYFGDSLGRVYDNSDLIGSSNLDGSSINVMYLSTNKRFLFVGTQNGNVFKYNIKNKTWSPQSYKGDGSPIIKILWSE